MYTLLGILKTVKLRSSLGFLSRNCRSWSWGKIAVSKCVNVLEPTSLGCKVNKQTYIHPKRIETIAVTRDLDWAEFRMLSDIIEGYRIGRERQIFGSNVTVQKYLNIMCIHLYISLCISLVRDTISTLSLVSSPGCMVPLTFLWSPFSFVYIVPQHSTPFASEVETTLFVVFGLKFRLFCTENVPAALLFLLSYNFYFTKKNYPELVGIPVFICGQF